MSEEGTAYHEAGHMVAAWELGLPVLGATIVPDEEQEYLGRVLCPIENRVRYADWADEDAYLYAHLVVLFAGPAASDRYTGEPLPPEAVAINLGIPGSDHYSIGDLVLSLAGPETATQEEVGERARRHAGRLLQARWASVEAVARALLEHETLDAMGCRRVLEDAFRN